MIQITPHMRVLVAVEPADFRRGIDGLAALCRAELDSDPFSGTLFVFRNRRRTAVKCLVYDGQGVGWVYERLSSGRYRCGRAAGGGGASTLRADGLAVVRSAGDPTATRAAPLGRRVEVRDLMSPG